ncbi:HD domain-containing protein [Candidatus Saccharibacteria bacterium]|nr:HD domain-containing protein [Candidatus Saccharibacteria bacterium]
MTLRDKANEIFLWGLDKRKDRIVSAWENHSRGAAEVAEKIAERVGMDKEKAYVMGLLHDIGRCYGPDTGMEHIIDGYNILMEKNMPEIARVCLTHSFNPKEKVNEINLKNPEEDAFLKRFLVETEYDDYDRLIQLADFMAGAHGVTTIERRFCSVLWRHGLKSPAEDLTTLYKIKNYFDKKAGIDVYEIFHEKIATTPFEGIPGKIETII